MNNYESIFIICFIFVLDKKNSNEFVKRIKCNQNKKLYSKYYNIDESLCIFILLY